jgi:protein O-mannosyl-transferase
MAKKKAKHEHIAKPVVQAIAENPWSIKGFRLQAVILVALSLIFYWNSFSNEYALDDGIVIVRNEYVQEGFEGIPDILTKDAYESYYRQLNSSNELKGGRYRPLSILSFAVEQQFMGATDKDSTTKMLDNMMTSGIQQQQREKIISEMHVRHVLNVFWYIASLLVLLQFMRYIVFKGYPLMAFVAAIIFAIHPIHTEVVANVKSRDEIMSVLFICLTFIYTFKYQEFGKKWMFAAALGSYFLALLSKEYAITLVVLLPLSLYLFKGSTIRKSIMTFAPFLIVIGVYMLLRLHTSAAVDETADTEVLNNPYLFASYNEEIATKISTSLNYIRLLLLPHPLSADYSYNSIPYKDFSNPLVWLSLVVYGGLAVTMFRFLRLPKDELTGTTVKINQARQQSYRSILCFAITFYLLNFLLICNLIFNIGGTMGERLIYHSSIGFAIAAAYLICKAAERIKPERTGSTVLWTFMAIIILLSGYKTITRNAEWKNNDTLFSADIKTVPNSVIVLGNLVSSLIDKANQTKDSIVRVGYLRRAIILATQATTIDPVYVTGFFNRGLSYFKLGELDEAVKNMDSVRAHYLNYPTLPIMNKQISALYLKKGIDPYAKNGNWNGALVEFKKGLALDSANAELWFNTGVAYFALHQVSDAVNSWKMTLKIKPGYAKAQQDLDFVLKSPPVSTAVGK